MMRDNPNRPLRLLGAASSLVVLGCLVLDKTKVPAHAAPLADECALYNEKVDLDENR